MNKVISIVLVVLVAVSCDDVTVKDIGDDNVILMTPADSASVTNTEVSFWWEWVEGASHYELMIASPDFDNPQELVLDTVIEKNTFKTTLTARRYQWCVTGLNAGYQTLTTCRTLEVAN